MQTTNQSYGLLDAPQTSWELLRWVLREPIALNEYDDSLTIWGRTRVFFPLAIRLMGIGLLIWCMARMIGMKLIGAGELLGDIGHMGNIQVVVMLGISILVGCWMRIRAGAVMLISTLLLASIFVMGDKYAILSSTYLNIWLPSVFLLMVWGFRTLKGFLSTEYSMKAATLMVFWFTVAFPWYRTTEGGVGFLFLIIFAMIVGVVMLFIAFLLSLRMKEIWAYFVTIYLIGGGISFYLMAVFLQVNARYNSHLFVYIVLATGMVYGVMALYPFVLLWRKFTWTFGDNPYMKHGYIGLTTQSVDESFFQLAKQHPEQANAFAQFLWDYRPMAQVFAYRLWEAGQAAKWAQGLEYILSYQPVILSGNLHAAFRTNKPWVKAYRSTNEWEEQLTRVKDIYTLYRQTDDPIAQSIHLKELAKAIDIFEYYNDQQHPHWREFYTEVVHAWEQEIEQLQQAIHST